MNIKTLHILEDIHIKHCYKSKPLFQINKAVHNKISLLSIYWQEAYTI